MKKTIIIISLISLSIASFGQAKPQPENKPVYQKYIKLQVNDGGIFLQSLENWKRLTLHDPTLADAAKVKTMTDIEAYIKDITTRLKVDSVRIDSVKAVVPPKKK